MNSDFFFEKLKLCMSLSISYIYIFGGGYSLIAILELKGSTSGLLICPRRHSRGSGRGGRTKPDRAQNRRMSLAIRSF